MSRRLAAGLVLAVLLLGGCIDPGEPGTLVPATVVDDPALPQVTIQVDGRERRIHLRDYGDPGAPPLLVVHASASDLRFYLPLTVLADRYHVILWDQRGNGLSERVPARELAFRLMAEEIAAVADLVAPDRRVSLIAHSWGAVSAALFMGAHPERVHQAVLIEPPGLKDEFMSEVGMSVDLFAPGYLEMVWSNELLAPADHELLDYKALMMVHSGVRNLFCDPDHPPSLPVWRLGGLALAVWESEVLSGMSYSYDFTAGLDRFPREVLLVGTECSPIGTEFQRGTNLTVFPQAELLHIPDSGHRLITEQLDLLLAGLDDYLEPDIDDPGEVTP